ncbi:MAG: Aerotolerance regulator N-terminal [Verrucomicrobia bacterium]|nr:MAG: Aerotolerance regulator N-terminal [Verrucomicrobiota bacterium]
MEWILGNPAGLWALLGLPAVLLIHLLQRRSQAVTISTLFLLQQIQRESSEGRKIDRIRSSVPLWLQLLMILLLTWLLVQPRWLRPESVQPVAVVLDDSASMSAFREEALKELLRVLGGMASSSGRTEYCVVGSSLAGRNYYRGTELKEVERMLGAWEPLTGEHEFTPALRVARNAVGPSGVVLLVTDHPVPDLPFEARLLAVGSPVENAGFTGLEVREENGKARWRAILRNYGEGAVERTWRLASGEQASTAQTIRLEPGEIRVLEGGFPEGGERLRLQLEPDAFAVDDVLPLLRPEPRVLFVRLQGSVRLNPLVEKVIASIEGAHPAQPDGPAADLVFAGYDPLNPALPSGNAVVFLDRPPIQGKPVAGRILAEDHELVSNLNWEPLIHLQSSGIPQTENDRVLVWREDKPLILLRRTPEGVRQLLFGFDVATSNAAQLPAFVLAIHRFAELVRLDKPVLERRILETGQPLRVPIADPAAVSVEMRFTAWDGSEDWRREVPVTELSQLRAPLKAGYLSIDQGKVPLLQGVTYFADAREGDFRKASRQEEISGMSVELVRRHTEQDLNWPLWTLLVMALLLASWGWMAWRQSLVEGVAAVAGR